MFSYCEGSGLHNEEEEEEEEEDGCGASSNSRAAIRDFARLISLISDCSPILFSSWSSLKPVKNLRVPITLALLSGCNSVSGGFVVTSPSVTA